MSHCFRQGVCAGGVYGSSGCCACTCTRCNKANNETMKKQKKQDYNEKFYSPQHQDHYNQYSTQQWGHIQFNEDFRALQTENADLKISVEKFVKENTYLDELVKKLISENERMGKEQINFVQERVKFKERENQQKQLLEKTALEVENARKELLSSQTNCKNLESQMKQAQRDVEQEKNLSNQLKQKILGKEKEIENFGVNHDLKMKELVEKIEELKITVEGLTNQLNQANQSIKMDEKKRKYLVQQIEAMKMTSLSDFMSLLLKDLSEIKNYERYRVNFTCFSTKEIQKEMRFLDDLSKVISHQVLINIEEPNSIQKRDIEICVADREKKRSNIITMIQTLRKEIKKEEEFLLKIQLALIFENKLNSQKLDEFCTMRSKLIDISWDLETRLLLIPNNLSEYTDKIEKVLMTNKRLDDKDEELTKLEGMILTQFPNKKSQEYKSEMGKLEKQRIIWRQEMAQLKIAKQEMIKQLDDYPELRFKLETMNKDEDPQDSNARFKNYLRSVNLFVDLNLKDHFPIRKNFKESLHLVKCTNLQDESKFLKKLVISNSKTLNEIQLLMLFNHPHIIKPELAFIDEEEVYLQFPFFEQTLRDWIKDKSVSEKRIMFFKILQTLSHIHSKFVIHRDIKFDNILVKNDEPMIIDFGIGKRDVIMQTGTLKVGTAYFMSPESDIGKTTFASDIWSVGVMMYDAFYGLEQFGGNLRDNIQFPKISGDDDETIVNLLKRILQLDPLLRPSASDLLLDPFFLTNERKKMMNDKMILEKSDKLKLFFESIPKFSGESIQICLPRTNVIEKLVDLVSNMDEKDLVKRFMVQYDGETGYGVGLTRELFTLFFDQLFKRTELWKQFEESALVIPSDQEGKTDDRIWNVIGKMMLMVLIHRIPVPCRFASFVYRFLAEDDANLNILCREVMELEPQIAKSTIELKPSDDLSWCADFNKDGKEVTSHNLIDFKKYRFESILIPNEICLGRLKEMRKGFQSIELKELKKKLTSFELRDIISGAPMTDPNELWSQIDASRLDKMNHDFMKQVVMELSPNQLRQLLYWITCLSALPLNGLEKKIQLAPSHQGFNAHTCFFQLEVYSLHNKYENFKKTFMTSLEQAQTGVFVEY